MMSHVVATGGQLVRRAAVTAYTEDPTTEMDWVLAGVLLLNFLVFAPVFVYISYTLGSVIPTLAMVEDVSPPAYEPVALSDDGAPNKASSPGLPASAPLTSSLRATHRMLRSIDGFRSLFRGIGLAAVLSLLSGTVESLFAPIVGGFPLVGVILATLVLVQLEAAWVHIVISPPSPLAFWRRLPPFRRTAEATWRPVLTYGAALGVAQYVPELLKAALGIDDGSSEPGRVPQWVQDGPVMAKLSAVFLVQLLLMLALVVPAQVALVRVQASLHAPEQDTIIPFDRSFGGKVDAALVGGKGYATMSEALSTFSKPAWIRLYGVYAKAFALGLATYVVMVLLLIPQIVLLRK